MNEAALILIGIVLFTMFLLFVGIILHHLKQITILLWEIVKFTYWKLSEYFK